MNLTGKWKGHYVYGAGYSLEYIGRSEEFILDLIDNDGIIEGVCEDPIVKMIENNSSFINGVFKDGFLSLIKHYKHPNFIIDVDSEFEAKDLSADGIHYTGILYKRFFSKKMFFKGEWVASVIYTDPNGHRHQSVTKGSWQMTQI